MNQEAKKRAMAQIRIDEGVVMAIYRCSLGHQTFGVGHLILETDPEYGQEDGTAVSEERVEQVFSDDFDIMVGECERVYGEHWHDFPDEVQEILVNLVFNVGANRAKGFKKSIAALERGDWKTAGDEMEDSLWFKQVGHRSERLVARMRAV